MVLIIDLSASVLSYIHILNLWILNMHEAIDTNILMHTDTKYIHLCFSVWYSEVIPGTQ